MKDRMLKILELAMEVNETAKSVIVSVDYSSLSALVNIYDITTDTQKTYLSAMSGFAIDGWVSDPGFVQAEAALKEILKGAKVA